MNRTKAKPIKKIHIVRLKKVAIDNGKMRPIHKAIRMAKIDLDLYLKMAIKKLIYSVFIE